MKNREKAKKNSFISMEICGKTGFTAALPSKSPEQDNACTVIHRGLDPSRLTPAAAEQVMLRLIPLLTGGKRRDTI